MRSVEGEGTRARTGAQGGGERVARLRHVVHGGAWPDHEDARRLVAADRARARDGERDDGCAPPVAAQLHALVAGLGPVERLTDDVERMAALHEWAVVADAAVGAAAAEHAGRFAAVVAAAAGDGRDDLLVLLGELDDGRLVGHCLAAEAGGGEPETTATFDVDGGFTLHTPSERARKRASSAVVRDRCRHVAVVRARLHADGDHGPQPFLVELTEADGRPAPGVELHADPSPGEGMRDDATVSFASVRLPFEALLPGPGLPVVLTREGSSSARLSQPGRDAAAARPWVASRICTTAACGAALRAGVTIALRGAETRASTAPARGRTPLFALRSRQRALVGALADAYAATALVNAAKQAWAERRGDDPGEHLRRRVDVTQALVSSTALEGLAACGELAGARGTGAGARIAKLAAFVAGTAAVDGEDGALLEQTAHGLLTGSGYEALAPVPRPIGELDLRDPAWWTWVARTAERHSHARAVVRMRDAMRRRPGDEFSAWNEVLPDAVDVARRYAVRLTVEAVVDDADRLADGGEEQMALLQAGALWYCRAVDRDAAYLAGHGTVGAETMALLPDLVDHLVDRLLPSLPTLLDAFALDEELLGERALSPVHAVSGPAAARRRGGAPAAAA
jgi:acyl-CoA oxidase